MTYVFVSDLYVGMDLQQLTSEVSSPGMASSSPERLVNVRDGISLVAEVGADIVRVAY